jgi:hypothetical protein
MMNTKCSCHLPLFSMCDEMAWIPSRYYENVMKLQKAGEAARVKAWIHRSNVAGSLRYSRNVHHHLSSTE